LTIWDEKISNWITEALRGGKRLGRNKIYDYVNLRYRKSRNKATNLSKDVFGNHLKFLVQNNIVSKDDAGQRGTTIEHFLTLDAEQQIRDKTLDLIALKKKNGEAVEITSQTKLKALYVLILMFNHTTSFEFRSDDELLSFLAPFHIKLDKYLRPARLADDNESKEIKKDRRHFQTRIESQDKSVTVSIHEYENPYHGGSTIGVYHCQIRGMTKNSVISNRIDKPFHYMSFSSKKLNEAFKSLCKDRILRAVPSSKIYKITDDNLYFLLFLLEDLFSEHLIPVMRNIWKNIRNPTSEEKNWLTLLEGPIQANKIIIEDIGERHQIESEIRQKTSGIETASNKMLRERKREKTEEIDRQLQYLNQGLNNYLKTYDFIINKHKSLQHIFELMFPEFLRYLELR
jgi:hypothetical protein